jgi:hypothetical protein
MSKNEKGKHSGSHDAKEQKKDFGKNGFKPFKKGGLVNNKKSGAKRGC